MILFHFLLSKLLKRSSLEGCIFTPQFSVFSRRSAELRSVMMASHFFSKPFLNPFDAGFLLDDERPVSESRDLCAAEIHGSQCSKTKQSHLLVL